MHLRQFYVVLLICWNISFRNVSTVEKTFLLAVGAVQNKKEGKGEGLFIGVLS